MKVSFTHSKSKIKALADAFCEAIMNNELQLGDNLPSINEASLIYNVSRDTVFKAYNELKRRGLIDSNPMKGYFVIGKVNHVLLLLDTYSPFKQILYNQFVSFLPENYKVDLIFHQYNSRLFDTIVKESIGRYSMYVVMNFSNTEFSESLKEIPRERLLLLDFGKFEKLNYSYFCQDFDDAFYECLSTAKQLLNKYTKLCFVFPEKLSHPVSSIDSFVRFCVDEQFSFEVIRRNSDWKGVENGTLYLCIQTEDMVKIIKDADVANFRIGLDIGLIAYNENPILEVIKNGITSISIDFGLLGEKAAKFVVSKELIQEYLPTKFIFRNSL
ncbi:MAG: GntR family transcriptional regulator [Paludibacter sp.]|nr:GntR family transcriptional regulator [Paludibacter sp.]